MSRVKNIWTHSKNIEHSKKLFEHGQKIFELADGLGITVSIERPGLDICKKSVSKF